MAERRTIGPVEVVENADWWMGRSLGVWLNGLRLNGVTFVERFAGCVLCEVSRDGWRAWPCVFRSACGLIDRTWSTSCATIWGMGMLAV